MSTEQFYKYFKQQNATSPNNILDPETNMESHSNERAEGPLDYPITDEEFEAAVNKLKANKSPGIDNILNQVIKIGKDAIKRHLVNLFNRILDTGKYPTLWSFGLIVPIHKKDDRSKVENYPRYHFAFCVRQALYINPQQSTVRLHGSKRNFES